MFAKVEVKCCTFTTEHVFYACMDVTTQLELYLDKQTHTVVNPYWRVGSQQFLS